MRPRNRSRNLRTHKTHVKRIGSNNDERLTIERVATNAILSPGSSEENQTVPWLFRRRFTGDWSACWNAEKFKFSQNESFNDGSPFNWYNAWDYEHRLFCESIIEACTLGLIFRNDSLGIGTFNQYGLIANNI